MAPLVTDNSTAEKQFFSKALYAHECAFSPVSRSTDSYFILTELGSFGQFSSSFNVLTYSTMTVQSLFSQQFCVVSLANAMFKGTKPMAGKELLVLRKTVSRLISKTPTTLRKK